MTKIATTIWHKAASHVIRSGAAVLDGLHREHVHGQALRLVEQVPLLVVRAAVAVVSRGRLQSSGDLLDEARLARQHVEHDHLALLANVQSVELIRILRDKTRKVSERSNEDRIEAENGP